MFNNFTAQAGIIANAGGTGASNDTQPSISWNFNNVLTMDFPPLGPENVNDRPRINTWRDIDGVPDLNFLIYLQAGRILLSPAPSGLTGEYWGDRSVGQYTLPELNLNENNNVIAGIDLFTHTFALPKIATLKPPIDQWVISKDPSVPSEIKYQYRFRPNQDNNVNIELDYNPECLPVTLPGCTGENIFVFVGTGNNGCPQFECRRPFMFGESGNLYPGNTWINGAGAANFGKWSFITEEGTLKEIANSTQNDRASIGNQAFFLAGHSGSGVRASIAQFTFDKILYNGEKITFNANFSWNKGARLISILTGSNSSNYLYRIRHQENDNLTFERRPFFNLPGQLGTITLNAFNQAYNFTISNLGSGLAFQVRDPISRALIFQNFYQRTGTNFNIVSGIQFYTELDDITGFGGSLDDWRNYGMFFNSIELIKAPADFSNPDVIPFPSYLLSVDNELSPIDKATFGPLFGDRALMSKDSSTIISSFPKRKNFLNGRATNTMIGAVYIYTGDRQNFWTIDKRFLGNGNFNIGFGAEIDLYKSGTNTILTVFDNQPTNIRSLPIPPAPILYNTNNDYYFNQELNVGKYTFYINDTGRNINWATGQSLTGSATVNVTPFYTRDWTCGLIDQGNIICEPGGLVLQSRTIHATAQRVSNFIRNKDFTVFFIKKSGVYMMYTGDPQNHKWDFASSLTKISGINNSDQYYRKWRFVPFEESMRTNELKWNKIEYSISEKLWMAIGSGECQGAKSTDGINWSQFNFPINSNWTDIAYGAGKWVVVNNSPIGFYSTNNGNTWSQINFPNGISCYKIAYGNGKWKGIPKWQPEFPNINSNNLTTGTRFVQAITGWEYRNNAIIPQQNPQNSQTLQVLLYTGDTYNYQPDILESNDGINWVNNKLPLNLAIMGTYSYVPLRGVRVFKKGYEPVTTGGIPIRWTSALGSLYVNNSSSQYFDLLKVPWSDIGYMESTDTWCILKKFKPEYNKADIYNTKYYYTSLMSFDGGNNWSGSRLFGSNLCINNSEKTFKTMGKIIRGTGQQLYSLPWRNHSRFALQFSTISSSPILNTNKDQLNNFATYSATLPGKINNYTNFALNEETPLEPDYTPPSISYTINNTDEFDNNKGFTVLPGDAEGGFLYDDNNNTLIYNPKTRWWPVDWKDNASPLPSGNITGFYNINFSQDWFAIPFLTNTNGLKDPPMYIMDVPSTYDRQFNIPSNDMFKNFPILWNTLYTNIASDEEKLISLCSSGVLIGEPNFSNPQWNDISSIDEIIGLSSNLLYGIKTIGGGLLRYQFIVFSGNPLSTSTEEQVWYPLNEKGTGKYFSFLKDNSSKTAPLRYFDLYNSSYFNNFFSQGSPTGLMTTNYRLDGKTIGLQIADNSLYPNTRAYFDFDRGYSFINTVYYPDPFSMSGKQFGFNIYNSLPGYPDFNIDQPNIRKFNEVITAVNIEGEKKYFGVHTVPNNTSPNQVGGIAPSGAGIYLYEFEESLISQNILDDINNESVSSTEQLQKVYSLQLKKVIQDAADFSIFTDIDNDSNELPELWPVYPTGEDELPLYPNPENVAPTQPTPYYYYNNMILPFAYTHINVTGRFPGFNVISPNLNRALNTVENFGSRVTGLVLDYIPNIVTGNRQLFAPIIPTGGFSWYAQYYINENNFSSPYILRPTGQDALSEPKNIYEGMKTFETTFVYPPTRSTFRSPQNLLLGFSQGGFNIVSSKLNNIHVLGGGGNMLRSGELGSWSQSYRVGGILILTGIRPQAKQLLVEKNHDVAFGYDTAISYNGNIIVVGCPRYYDINSLDYNNRRGAIQIFTGTEQTEWRRCQILTGFSLINQFNTAANFGREVAISADAKTIIVVGSESPLYGDQPQYELLNDYLYIYTGNGINNWSFKQKIKPPPIYKTIWQRRWPGPPVVYDPVDRVITGEQITDVHISNNGGVVSFRQGDSGYALYVGNENIGWSFKQYIGSFTGQKNASSNAHDPNLNFTFNTSMSMNYDGSTIAVTNSRVGMIPPTGDQRYRNIGWGIGILGSTQNQWAYDEGRTYYPGAFKIYNGNPTNGWTLKKAEVISGVGFNKLSFDIYGRDKGAQYGTSCAISDDGKIFAIGSDYDVWPNYDSNFRLWRGRGYSCWAPRDTIQYAMCTAQTRGGVILYTGDGQNNWIEKQRIYGFRNKILPAKQISFNNDSSKLTLYGSAGLMTFLKDSPIPYVPLIPAPPPPPLPEPLLYISSDKSGTSLLNLTDNNRCIWRVSGRLQITDQFFKPSGSLLNRLYGNMTVKLEYGERLEYFTLIDRISISAGNYSFEVLNKLKTNDTDIYLSTAQIYDIEIFRGSMAGGGDPNFGITTGTVELSPRGMSDRMIYPSFFGLDPIRIECPCISCI